MTHDEIIKMYDYDPDTGVLINRLNNRAVGFLCKDGYMSHKPAGGRQTYKLHRLIWFYMKGQWPENTIDHINGIRTDNRWVNLRDVTIAENLQNLRSARSDNASGLLGVDFHKASGKWRSQIKIKGVKKHIGYFDTAIDAHMAYLAKKKEIHPCAEISKLPSWLLPKTS